MDIAFHASAVALFDPDDSCFLVGFADEEQSPQQYLMLQRAFEDDVDEQDVKLGLDTYHLEWRDQLYSLYGGIARFVLHRDRLECEFSAKGSAALDGVGHARIGFDLDEPEFRLLRQRLKDIFRGTDCLHLAPGQERPATP